MNEQKNVNFFNKIYNETYSQVLKYVSLKCNRIDDISDIMQDIYLEVYGTIVRRGEVYFRNNNALVLYIAKSKINKYYSLKNKLKIFTSIFIKNNDDEEYNLTDSIISGINIIEKVANDDLLDRIWKYLNAKSKNIGKIFYLYYYLDLTISEISKELNISQENVKSKIYRTLKEIKTKFGKEIDRDV